MTLCVLRRLVINRSGGQNVLQSTERLLHLQKVFVGCGDLPGLQFLIGGQDELPVKAAVLLHLLLVQGDGSVITVLWEGECRETFPSPDQE